jgi:hypothetical protein
MCWRNWDTDASSSEKEHAPEVAIEMTLFEKKILMSEE